MNAFVVWVRAHSLLGILSTVTIKARTCFNELQSYQRIIMFAHHPAAVEREVLVLLYGDSVCESARVFGSVDGEEYWKKHCYESEHEVLAIEE